MVKKQPFRERLAEGPILSDGAMGTMLHNAGIPIDTCFDELNLSDPATVFHVHQEYLEAGAEIVETNTFGANRYKLAEHGLEDRVREINAAGVRLARQAAEAAFRPNVYIGGSVGPLGVRLEPYGRVTRKDAYDAFREQIEALIDSGVDLLIIETFSDLYEISEAIRAARDVSADVPIIADMTFTRDDRTLLGDTPGQVAETLSNSGADVIGVNCSNGPAQIMRVVREMRAAAPDATFSAVPNAGWPEYIGGRVMYHAGADYFADYALALRDQGVTVVGGCCGTTPEHIAAMRAALDEPDRQSTIAVITVVEEAAPEEMFSEAPSELAVKLARGDFIIACEMSPPKGISAEKVLRAAEMLCGAGADVIDVNDSPMARMRMSPWAVCHALEQAGMETVLHFPTRGRNLLRVQGDLLAAHALGLRNLFVVMGDPTHIGDYPEAADNYDIVPSGLVRLIKRNLNHGLDSAGNKIGQPTSYLVSTALNLGAPDLDREVRIVHRKLEAGSDYFLTQPVFEADSYNRFMDRYEATHGPFPAPVLIGLMPLYGLRHAAFLHNEVPGITIPGEIMKRIEDAGDDAPHEGVRIAQELAAQITARGAAGLYLMPQFRRYDLVAEIIESIRVPA